MEEVFSVFDSFSGSISFTVYTRMLPNVLLVWRRLWSVMFSACNLKIISFFWSLFAKKQHSSYLQEKKRLAHTESISFMGYTKMMSNACLFGGVFGQ
jgi:hypothetical protein